MSDFGNSKVLLIRKIKGIQICIEKSEMKSTAKK